MDSKNGIPEYIKEMKSLRSIVVALIKECNAGNIQPDILVCTDDTGRNMVITFSKEGALVDTYQNNGYIQQLEYDSNGFIVGELYLPPEVK